MPFLDDARDDDDAAVTRAAARKAAEAALPSPLAAERVEQLLYGAHALAHSDRDMQAAACVARPPVTHKGRGVTSTKFDSNIFCEKEVSWCHGGMGSLSETATRCV